MALSILLIYFIVLVVFFDTLSLLPLISPFAVYLGAGSLLAGVVVSTYSFANFAGNLVSGYFIDRIGRKFTLISGLLIAGLGALSYTVAQSAGQLVLFRVIHGLGGALLVPAAFTLIADRAPEGETSKAMGKAGSLIGISALIGPPVATIIRDKAGFNSVFILIASLFAFTLILVILFLPGDNIVHHNPDRLKLKDFAGSFFKLFGNPKLLTACLGGFSLMCCQGVLAFLLPLYMQSLGYPSAMVGALFATFAVFAIATMILSKHILTKFKHLDTKSLAGISLCLILIPFFENLTVLFLILAAYGIFFGIIFTYTTNSVAQSTLPGKRGTAFSIFYACFSLGVVVGPILSGLFSFQDTYAWGFLGVGILILMASLLIWVKKR